MEWLKGQVFLRSIYSYYNLDCGAWKYRITIFSTKTEMVNVLKIVKLKSLVWL